MRRATLCSFSVAVMCVAGVAMGAGPELVGNPTYASWAACKVGTTVTHRETMEITMAGMAKPMQIERTITQVLKESKPETITVEVTVTATADGKPAPSVSYPAKSTAIPSKIGKEAADLPSDIPASQVKDLKAGNDKVEVACEKYDATTVEFTQEGAGGLGPDVTEMKMWLSADVPGRLLKLEGQRKAPNPWGFQSSKTLVEVKGN